MLSGELLFADYKKDCKKDYKKGLQRDYKRDYKKDCKELENDYKKFHEAYRQQKLILAS